MFNGYLNIMSTSKKYYAFISYNSNDLKTAEWLQKKLTSFKLPSVLQKEREDIPRYIRPVFRDKTNMSGGNLSDEIITALNQSQYLIVLCSPHSAHSNWVNKEVSYFISHGLTNYIIPFIIDGIPNSHDEKTECFCPALLSIIGTNKERLGIDIKDEEKLGKNVPILKIISVLLNLNFDSVWDFNKAEEKKKRRRNFIAILSTLVIVILSIFIFITQNLKIQYNNNKEICNAIENQIDSGLILKPMKNFIEFMPKEIKDYNNSLPTEAIELLYKINYMGCISSMYTNNSNIVSKAISPDATLIAYFDESNKLNIWNRLNNKLIYSSTFDSTIRQLIFDRDCKSLIIVSESTVQIISLATLNLRTIYKDFNRIDTAVLSPDNQTLCINHTSCNHVELINIDTDKCTEVSFSKDLTSIHTGIKYSKNGDFLFLFSRGNIQIYDIKRETVIRKIEGNQSIWYDDCDISNNHKYLIISKQNKIELYDFHSNKKIRTIINQSSSSLKSLNFSDDNSTFYASWSNRVSIYNVNNEQHFEENADFSTFSRFNEQFLTCSNNGIICIYDRGKRQTRYNTLNPGIIRLLSKTNKESICLSKNIILFSEQNKLGIISIKNNSLSNVSSSGKFNNDGSLICFTHNNKIKILNVNTFNPIFEYTFSHGYIEKYTISKDNKYLAVEKGNQLYIFDLRSKRLLLETPESKTIADFRFSPNHAAYFILRYDDFIDNEELYLYELSPQVKIVSRIHPDRCEINSAEFSNSGKKIITTNDNKTINIWDISTKKIINEKTIKLDIPIQYANFHTSDDYIALCTNESLLMYNLKNDKQYFIDDFGHYISNVYFENSKTAIVKLLSEQHRYAINIETHEKFKLQRLDFSFDQCRIFGIPGDVLLLQDSTLPGKSINLIDNKLFNFRDYTFSPHNHLFAFYKLSKQPHKNNEIIYVKFERPQMLLNKMRENYYNLISPATSNK